MSSLADLLSLGMPQGSLGAAAPRGMQFNIPQAAPQQQQHDGPSKFRNFLGALGDALSGEPLYQQRMQQQQQTRALQGFLTNPDDAIAKLMQVNPTLGIELYKGAHPPSEKTMEQKVFEYEQGLDPSQRPAFEKSIALTHPGMMSPVTLGPTDTYDPGGGTPTGEVTATGPNGEKVRLNPQTGQWEPMGGATGKPSPTFPGGSMKNNPGALRVPGSMQFQSFANPAEGIHAQQALLSRYMGHGFRNVSDIVERYAPRRSRGGDNSDEQVNNYIGYVSKRLGVNPQDALSPALLPRLSEAMREFETGKRAF